MKSTATCANCGRGLIQSIPNPRLWTHPQNDSNVCPVLPRTYAAPDPATIVPGTPKGTS